MSGDGSVGGFGFDGTIGGIQNGGHESERSVTCIKNRIP